MSREIAEIRNELRSWTLVNPVETCVGYRSPSNIALLKYWGKRPYQMPVNPSLSFCLTKAITETRLSARFQTGFQGLSELNGDPEHPFLKKIKPFWEFLCHEIPLLQHTDLSINTHNSFPHGAGIASSASGFSALALAVLDLAQILSRRHLAQDEFLKYASYLARMGSGSASRSIYPAFNLWGASPDFAGSSDLFSIDVNDRIHPAFRNLQDAILLVSSREKSLSSTHGHALMQTHPFAEGRIQQARQHLQHLQQALPAGDWELLATVAEAEALSLHALIMSSSGGTILLEPASIELIQRIRHARTQGLQVFFTIDAGPNIHLIYPEIVRNEVNAFVRNNLQDICPENQVIFDSCGPGPEKLRDLP